MSFPRLRLESNLPQATLMPIKNLIIFHLGANLLFPLSFVPLSYLPRRVDVWLCWRDHMYIHITITKHYSAHSSTLEEMSSDIYVLKVI